MQTLMCASRTANVAHSMLTWDTQAFQPWQSNKRHALYLQDTREIHWQAHSCHAITCVIWQETHNVLNHGKRHWRPFQGRDQSPLAAARSIRQGGPCRGHTWQSFLSETQQPLNEEKNQTATVSEPAFSHGGAFSCSRFPPSPDEVPGTFPPLGWNTFTT